MECLFCNIVNKKVESYIIYEDEWTIAFLDLYPNDIGHTLVIPKKHFENFLETDNLYLNKVLATKKTVAKLLEKKLNPKGFNFISNCGSEAFQVIFHYHEHIVPKYKKEIGYNFKINKDVNNQEKINDIYQLLTNKKS